MAAPTTPLASMPRPETLLSVDRLSCAAGSRTLFDELSFELRGGSWAALTGPNGSGKTTLLRAIAGLVRPLSGSVHWNGLPRSPGDAAWNASMLHQGHAAGWKNELSAARNLDWQARLDHAEGIAPAMLSEALEFAGLATRRDIPFARLSAGQRRRLNLARLRCSPHALWLLDEPSTALDDAGLRLLIELLDTHLARGGCAVVATHGMLALSNPPLSVRIASIESRETHASA